MNSVRDAAVTEKRVLLRVDFNVPIVHGQIYDNHRIRATLPTIQYLIDNRAKIILATHIGDPQKGNNTAISTAVIAKELARLLNREVYRTNGLAGPEVEKMVQSLKPGEIMLLENLRLDTGESQDDEDFARNLAKLAEIYVNDAFGVCHRVAASTMAITKYLPSYAGLLLESEITTLNLLLNKPKRPFVIIIGGAKVKDKAGVINNMASEVDMFLLGGMVANTFLVASGLDIGSSAYDRDMIDDCKTILEKHQSKIVLPDDGVQDNGQILDIGPATVRRFSSEIRKAESVFWNGCMGKIEEPKYTEGSRAIAQAMKDNRGATKVVAGGDTVGYLSVQKQLDGFSFVSTGGGASLHFLAGESLPGLEALKKAQLDQKEKIR